MTVWLLFRDDGNVCCPAEEFVDVFASETAANAAKDAHIAGRAKYDTDNYWIVERKVIA